MKYTKNWNKIQVALWKQRLLAQPIENRYPQLPNFNNEHGFRIAEPSSHVLQTRRKVGQ